MKRIFKILFITFGLLGLGVIIFVVIRIRENDEKAALRQAEAEKHQVSQAEAQQLDLGGFMENEFRVLPEPPAGVSAPTPEQWRGLRQGLEASSPALAAFLPPLSPVVAPGYGRLRYAAKPEAWRLMVDCRTSGPVSGGCEPVAVAFSALSESEAAGQLESINGLATEGLAVYGALHGHRGTEGMDKLIKEGNLFMVYNEFCSELGCNGSVTWLNGKVLGKVEGSGNLQPWFAALARSGNAGGKR